MQAMSQLFMLRKFDIKRADNCQITTVKRLPMSTVVIERFSNDCRTWRDWFWFCFSLVEKLARVFQAKPKPIARCTRNFSRALSELQVIARKSDWFIALSAPAVIGRSNCFGFGFSTVV